MNNNPKKHHYLPQCYLKGFQCRGRKTPQILVYNKDFPQKHPFVSSIKNTACIERFHDVNVDGVPDKSIIEGMLSDVENLLIAVVKEVIDTQCISNENKYGLTMLILMLKYRVPKATAATTRYFKRMLETIAEINFCKNNLSLSGSFKDNFKLIVHNNCYIANFFKAFCNKRAIFLICTMYFSLLKAPSDNYFLCSDSPVSYFVPNHDGARGVGLLHNELEIFLPLNKNYGLLCSRQGGSQTREISPEEINEYNRRTIISASKYVYSPVKNELINALLEENKNVFSGTIQHEFDTPNGRFLYSAFIPVTSK